MPSAPTPLDKHQQGLVNIVRAAHDNLAVARKTRVTESRRRLEEARIQFQRALDTAHAQIEVELDAELAKHQSALDQAIIAAYEADVPVRRIALDGFGNRYDGAVHQLLRELRADGRVGNRDGYQRNVADEAGHSRRETRFPEPVDVEGILAKSAEVIGPRFEALPHGLVLVEADAAGENEVRVPAVVLSLDERDRWFRKIASNARSHTPFLKATYCTLYEHPATGELMAHESKETGEVTWDHPVARWAKDHPEEARRGFHEALLVDRFS